MDIPDRRGRKPAGAERSDVQFGSPAAEGVPTRDFLEMLCEIQRRNREPGVTSAISLPGASVQARANCIEFLPQTGDNYAVILARVTGMAKLSPARLQNSKPPSPLSARILAGLQEHRTSFLYLLFGAGSEVALYVGVKSRGEKAASEARTAFNSLKTCLKAVYPDIRRKPLESAEEYTHVLDRLKKLPIASSLVGNPSYDSSARPDESAADRLIRALAKGEYCFFVEAEPVPRPSVLDSLRGLTATIAEVHRYVKQTSSAATTSVSQQSHEQVDRVAQYCERLLEVGHEKLEAGLGEGMWRSSATLLTRDEEQREWAGALLRSVFAGRESQPQPIEVHFHQSSQLAAAAVATLRSPVVQATQPGILDLGTNPLQTALCSSDLGLLVELPRKEAAGFRVTIPRDFALDVDEKRGRQVQIGKVLGPYGPTSRTFNIQLDDLTRHVMVAGVTGSGKTNTNLHILNQLWGTYRIPFLVIEPAKAQYRNLLGAERFTELQVFAPGYRQVAPLRLNPFEFPPGVDPQAHIAHLYTVFNAAFILYAPMPYVLERALYEVYEDRGWDLGAGKHPEENPETGDVHFLAFPTLSDLYQKIGEVVDRLGYDQRIRMDVTAGLQARVDSLRVGQKGQTFDCRRSVPFDAILSKPTILELAHLGSDDERAFFMGLLLMRLYETLTLAGESPGLKHVTLIEEAHRLLTKTATDVDAETANTKGQAVGTFCNILAEIRAYGEGVIVADQIPSKLASDVLKNTNLKIMHRIVASDDRELMGGTMNLLGQQKMAVTALPRGQAAVFAEGSETPSLVAVPLFPSVAAASDADVHAVNEAFYGACPEVRHPMPGCAHCGSVCRYAAWAKRLAMQPEALAAVWGYAISSLDGSLRTDAWETLKRRLLPDTTAPTLKGETRRDLMWCVLTTASDRAFWKLCERGITLVDLESLATCFSTLADADRSMDAAARDSAATECRSRIAALLKRPFGPLRGCGQCVRPCVYEPLGRFLATRPGAIGEVRTAFEAADLPQSVSGYCRNAAAQVLFTAGERLVEELAICFFAHVAEHVGSRDPVANIRQVFKKSKVAPE
jgi:hypothetical protein